MPNYAPVDNSAGIGITLLNVNGGHILAPGFLMVNRIFHRLKSTLNMQLMPDNAATVGDFVYCTGLW